MPSQPPVLQGLDKQQTEELAKGIKEQLYALEGHQDPVLVEYIMVLLASGKEPGKIKQELETFMSSPVHSDRLVRCLFDKYKALHEGCEKRRLEHAPSPSLFPTTTTTTILPPTTTFGPPSGRPSKLKSVVVQAAPGASVCKPHSRPLTARSMLRTVVDSIVKSNREQPQADLKDARDIINMKRSTHRPGDRMPPIQWQGERPSCPDGHAEENKSVNIIMSKGAAETAAKVSRCPDFPDCPLPDNECPHVHPKETCKYFPNCLYGKQCLFIHPPVACRFEDRCSNQFCNFTHPIPGAAPAAQPPIPAPSTLSIPCRFNERCRRPDCPFLHSVASPCLQGAQCMKPACPFIHPVDHAMPAPRSLVNRPCRFGKACAKADCPFQHPSKPDLPPATSMSIANKEQL